jgi:hypothetical protein
MGGPLFLTYWGGHARLRFSARGISSGALLWIAGKWGVR